MLTAKTPKISMANNLLPYVGLDIYSSSEINAKKTSPMQDKIKAQKNFLFNMLINQAKFTNPLSETDSNDISVKMIGNIAELDRMDLQYQSMQEANQYNKMLLKSNIIGKGVMVLSDEISLNDEGSGSMKLLLENGITEDETMRAIIYDKEGKPIVSQEINPSLVTGLKKGMNNIKFTLDPENLQEIAKSGAKLDDLKCIFLLKTGNDTESRVKTYATQTVESVFIESGEQGDDGDYVITDKGSKQNLNNIKGFSLTQQDITINPHLASINTKQRKYSTSSNNITDSNPLGEIIHPGTSPINNTTSLLQGRKYLNPQQENFDLIHQSTIDLTA